MSIPGVNLPTIKFNFSNLVKLNQKPVEPVPVPEPEQVAAPAVLTEPVSVVSTLVEPSLSADAVGPQSTPPKPISKLKSALKNNPDMLISDKVADKDKAIYSSIIVLSNKLNTIAELVLGKLNTPADKKTPAELSAEGEIFAELTKYVKAYAGLIKSSGLENYLKQNNQLESDVRTYRIAEQQLAFLITSDVDKKYITEEYAIGLFDRWMQSMEVALGKPKPKS